MLVGRVLLGSELLIVALFLRLPSLALLALLTGLAPLAVLALILGLPPMAVLALLSGLAPLAVVSPGHRESVFRVFPGDAPVVHLLTSIAGGVPWRLEVAVSSRSVTAGFKRGVREWSPRRVLEHC